MDAVTEFRTAAAEAHWDLFPVGLVDGQSRKLQLRCDAEDELQPELRTRNLNPSNTDSSFGDQSPPSRYRCHR